MPSDETHIFGGAWTQQKLQMLDSYLRAYRRALKNQPFRLMYIDAFAGTGYRIEVEQGKPQSQLLFPWLADEDTRGFIDGSARIALQVEPAFDEYIFIEKSAVRCCELRKLKGEYPGLSDRVSVVRQDCNVYLRKLCKKCDWRNHRAVLFLDPFGMQVAWDTVKAIAHTKAIDVWILWPLGVAVNRLLKRNGDIRASWRARLDSSVGTSDWYEAFYQKRVVPDLFQGHVERTEKVADFDSLSRYYNERLGTIFEGVADNPRRLHNSRGNPIYLLCFAAGNAKGAPIAVRIAQHILKG